MIKQGSTVYTCNIPKNCNFNIALKRILKYSHQSAIGTLKNIYHFSHAFPLFMPYHKRIHVSLKQYFHLNAFQFEIHFPKNEFPPHSILLMQRATKFNKFLVVCPSISLNKIENKNYKTCILVYSLFRVTLCIDFSFNCTLAFVVYSFYCNNLLVQNSHKWNIVLVWQYWSNKASD